MFIQTEETPNPATMKFLPGKEVLGERSPIDFETAANAKQSPLAEALFAIDGVRGVFFGRDFITVTRADKQDWRALKTNVLAAIMDHFTSGKPLLRAGEEDTTLSADVQNHQTDEGEIVKQIRELLDLKIRPAVAQDGGDITFHSYEDGTVFLHLKGSCAGCPSSTATLKVGIENMLKHYIPEIKDVQQIR